VNDPEQWEIEHHTIPHRGDGSAATFFFGTHTLTMEVQDNSGYCSRVEVKVNIVQFTLERSLWCRRRRTTERGRDSRGGPTAVSGQ